MKKIIIVFLSLFMLVACSGQQPNDNSNLSHNNEQVETVIDNSGQDFDLRILKLENRSENFIYSPLSIKYCLSMLSDGAGGSTKEQLDNLIGSYVPKSYTNSENLSLANMIVVKDTLENKVNDSFLETIKEKYNAEFELDSFTDLANINNWISNNTFNMINNYIDSFNPELKFLIINALAIDMEWVNKLQEMFDYNPAHEQYFTFVRDYSEDSYPIFAFNGSNAKGTNFTAVANKYDIIDDLGEDNIRETVANDLRESLNENSDLLQAMSSLYGTGDSETVINNYLEEYMNEISQNYGYYGESTDFYYYIDDSINAFAKDLKEYDGTQFQFVAIMPTNEKLSSYIDSKSNEDINNIINSLKAPSYDDFEEGYITEIKGLFPTFSFTYDLNLDDDLKKIGVTDIFDINKANLCNIISDEAISVETKHKSTIDLSNEGIKASAITLGGGLGAAGFYDYIFEVPVKTIELNFDKPFLFLIRNKDTNEIWFVGTLYEADKPNITLMIYVDAIKIRNEPSTNAEQIGLAKKYDILVGTGNTIEAEGYTWYELADGGWIADKNNEWLHVDHRY